MDYVHRTNLIPDPRFQHVDRLKSSGVTVQAFDHENGRRYVRAMYDGVGTDPYLNIANDIITVPGSYRLFYNVFALGGDGKLNIYTRESSKPNNYVLAYSMPVGNGQTIRQASNQLTLNALTIVRIVPPKTAGGLIMITECNLERASTFDEAYPYFDWSTMPRETGGGVFLLALLILVLSALNGGWRHERAGIDSQLVPGPVPDRDEDETGTGERDGGILDESVYDGERQGVEGRVLRGDVDHYRASGRQGTDRVREIRRVGTHGSVQTADSHEIGFCQHREFGGDHGCERHLNSAVHRTVGRHHQVEVVRVEQGRGGYGIFTRHDHRDRDVRPDQRIDRRKHGVRLQSDARPTTLALGVVA